MIDYWKDISEIASNFATVIAALAAAFFFGWKLVAGWLVVNLELNIHASRKAYSKGEDFLSLTLYLRKGNIDTLQIKDISLQIRNQLNNTIINRISFPEISRLHVDSSYKLNWDKEDADKRLVSLSPGESFPLSRTLIVPNDIPLLIEAAVFGNRAFWRKRGFQWRASVSCLPEQEIIKSHEGS